MQKEYPFQKEKPTIRIWMVDDNKHIFQVVEKYLKRLGNIEIEWIPNGQELLRKFEVGDFPDVILLDNNLGEGQESGEQLLEKIRPITNAKIIAHSSDMASNQQMLKKGADFAFRKGLEINELANFLRTF